MYGWQSDGNSEVITLDEGVYERAGLLNNAFRLGRSLKEAQPTYLFIPGYREPLAILAAFWGKLHGRINVLMLDSTAMDQARSGLREAIKTWMTRILFDKAFVSGKRSAAYLQSLTGGSLPYEQGYDVVDNTYFANCAAEIRHIERSDALHRSFLFAGRLAEEKNLPLLIDAYRGYKRDGGRRNLEIVGHGPMEESLRILVRQNELDDYIHFHGFQPYDSMPAWYSGAACLVLPSISEPWGLVVNEAMASGLPVIVSDRCGCADDLVEDGGNGYIFSADNSDLLVKCMLTFDALSEADREAMGRRSLEIITRFSPATWSDAVLRLVEGKPKDCAAA
jgi:glycosyltransferase involved in cell wall biosynthesis